MSPGVALEGFRTGWRQFLIDAVNVGAMSAVDWVGCHCYWQTPQGIKDPNEGAHWKEYQRFAKTIFVTEFSNPAAGVDKLEKAQQMVQFVAGLDLTVRAAFAFVSSASNGAFPHETWTNEMADIVGARG